MNLRRHTLVRCISAVALAASVFGGCSSSGKCCKDGSCAKCEAAGAVNTVCPVGGEAVPKNAPTSTYNGTTIAFCCTECQAQFNAMSASQKDEVVRKAMAGR